MKPNQYKKGGQSITSSVLDRKSGKICNVMRAKRLGNAFVLPIPMTVLRVREPLGCWNQIQLIFFAPSLLTDGRTDGYFYHFAHRGPMERSVSAHSK